MFGGFSQVWLADLLYSVIVFVATLVGATTGVGGGAIIKPVFDLVGQDQAVVIGIYSTVAVFSMCISSLYKHSKTKQGFDLKLLLIIALGSLVGGFFGDKIFKLATQSLSNSQVTVAQSLLLSLVLFFVLVYNRYREFFPNLQIRKTWLIFSFGLFAGSLSVFLGIGGGPLNTLILLGLMGMTVKESTPYSIGMIFFAQLPKLILIFLGQNPDGLRLYLFPVLGLIAVLGGYLGTQLNLKLSERRVILLYNLLMLVLIAICLINIFRNS